MTYPVLAVLFFLSILIIIVLIACFLFKLNFFRKQKTNILVFTALWFIPYGLFIIFFTGPQDLNQYPSQNTSPYKLPWKSGVKRFVAQGNRSFTSHRDFHFYAWDFVMPNGAEVLSSRKGKVVKIEDYHDGIGLLSNYLLIEHEDGTKAGYAHIQKDSSLVKLGNLVKQGQPIALSGMVGQTLFPHLHFYVINSEGTSSMPISFQEVEGGIPFAGNFYLSNNFQSTEGMEVVSFKSNDISLKGELYKPQGKGPFPVVLFNHGSAPGMLNSQASKAIAPLFVKRGWAFFMPYRRGQGLSSDSGPYVMDQIKNSIKKDGFEKGVTTLVNLHRTEQLSDQLAAFKWLQAPKYVKKSEVATLGNSFGGIQVMLGMAKVDYCAGVNASGGAQSWKKAPALQRPMKDAARETRAPILFFQAKNDYDLLPSKVLSNVMKKSGKEPQIKFYPAFGKSKKDGHSFPYKSVTTWFDDVFIFLQKNCIDQ